MGTEVKEAERAERHEHAGLWQCGLEVRGPPVSFAWPGLKPVPPFTMPLGESILLSELSFLISKLIGLGEASARFAGLARCWIRSQLEKQSS